MACFKVDTANFCLCELKTERKINISVLIHIRYTTVQTNFVGTYLYVILSHDQWV